MRVIPKYIANSSSYKLRRTVNSKSSYIFKSLFSQSGNKPFYYETQKISPLSSKSPRVHHFPTPENLLHSLVFQRKRNKRKSSCPEHFRGNRMCFMLRNSNIYDQNKVRLLARWTLELHGSYCLDGSNQESP